MNLPLKSAMSFVELEDFQDGVRFASTIPIQPCNFFNRIDQALDHCHTIFAHRENFVEEWMRLVQALEADEGARALQ